MRDRVGTHAKQQSKWKSIWWNNTEDWLLSLEGNWPILTELLNKEELKSLPFFGQQKVWNTQQCSLRKSDILMFLFTPFKCWWGLDNTVGHDECFWNRILKQCAPKLCRHPGWEKQHCYHGNSSMPLICCICLQLQVQTEELSYFCLACIWAPVCTEKKLYICLFLAKLWLANPCHNFPRLSSHCCGFNKSVCMYSDWSKVNTCPRVSTL